MARRHNDAARTREQLLAKATEEFARLGFEGGRVDRIALRCRLSKNMLYYYFHSKEKLFVAVLERMYERMRHRQEDLPLRTNNPVLALKQLIRHTFQAMRDDPSIIRLINEENKHKAKFLRKSRLVKDLYNPLLETISLILDGGYKEGAFRKGLDPVLVYLTLSSLCYHYLSNQYTLQIALSRDLQSDAAHDKWLAHTIDVILTICTADAKTAALHKVA